MSRRTVLTCVVGAFSLAPAALAAEEIPGGAIAPATGGATAPAAQAPALAPTPADAVERAPVSPAGSTVPAPAPASPPGPTPAAVPAAVEIVGTPELRPTSAVTAQNDDGGVVDVPVPRGQPRATPAPAPPVAARAPRLPMTGFDVGMFTSAALIMIGAGVGLSAAVGPAPRHR